MSVKPDQKYDGTVSDGAKMVVSQSGTLGFFLRLHCEDGEISHTIWLTDNTKERALETFALLGVTEAQLQDAVFVRDKLASAVEGREVSFTTTEEKYKGKSRVKVGFINKRNRSVGGSPVNAAVAFFGGTPITDDDIPF